jgi:hypothetical protein
MLHQGFLLGATGNGTANTGGGGGSVTGINPIPVRLAGSGRSGIDIIRYIK